MSRQCTEGLCPGPKDCWLRGYLAKPGPTLPGLPPDDTNAADRLQGCPIRQELETQYPRPFEEARRLPPRR